LILIILNEPETGNTLVGKLVEPEHDVTICNNFETAAALLERDLVDLIICDLALIESHSAFENAFDFLAWTKRNNTLRHIPFLCFSVKTMINEPYADGVNKAAKALGASNCLSLDRCDDSSLRVEVQRLLKAA